MSLDGVDGGLGDLAVRCGHEGHEKRVMFEEIVIQYAGEWLSRKVDRRH